MPLPDNEETIPNPFCSIWRAIKFRMEPKNLLLDKKIGDGAVKFGMDPCSTKIWDETIKFGKDPCSTTIWDGSVKFGMES